MNEGVQTSPGGDLRVFFDVWDIYQAQDFLRKRGITWDNIHREAAHVKPWGEAVSSPVAYFRKGNFEVAYLVDGIGLAIFGRPRRWW